MNTHSISKKNLALNFLSRYGIVLAFILICILLSFANQYFLTIPNIKNILLQISINGILAVGMTFVILTGGIDLSVGSILAVAGIAAALLAKGGHYNGLLPVLGLGVGLGLVLGSCSGILVARLKVPPFIATLGMLSAARGLALIYNDGMPVPGLPAKFRFLGNGYLDSGDNIPMATVIFFLVFIISLVVLRKTVYGRYIYAVGGNEKSAKTSGISTRLVKFSAYAISGSLAALAGIILAARTGSALPQAGVAYELDAIAAVVIGGASLTGGVGSLWGTLIGILIIGVISNGLDLMGISSYYQQVIKGVIIVGAVLIDVARKSEK